MQFFVRFGTLCLSSVLAVYTAFLFIPPPACTLPAPLLGTSLPLSWVPPCPSLGYLPAPLLGTSLPLSWVPPCPSLGYLPAPLLGTSLPLSWVHSCSHCSSCPLVPYCHTQIEERPIHYSLYPGMQPALTAYAAS